MPLRGDQKMNRMKITAIALATLAIGATSAQAGCKFSQISGKTFGAGQASCRLFFTRSADFRQLT
jgi:hypothetical protein